MDYKKRLKQRLYIAIIYTVLGVLMCVAAFVSKTANSFISPFGTALVVCGIVRLRNYFLITKDEESIRKNEIRETDERNLEIAKMARSMTFTLFISLSGLAVIILEFMNMPQHALPIAYLICFFMILYLICYFYAKRKY